MGEILDPFILNSTEKTYCGYVTIVGCPNAGKSTLMNLLVGDKVAITTPKPQTTRDNITGILTENNRQIVFMDTPGIHHSTKLLNRNLVDYAVMAMDDGDLIYFLVDVKEGIADNIKEEFREMIKKVRVPCFLVLNKTDLASPEEVAKCREEFSAWRDFDDIFEISALDGENTKALLKQTEHFIPEGPYLYPEDYLTDRDERFFVSEIIREKIFLLLKKEVPYATAVVIEQFEEREDGKDYIYAQIYVETPSQKQIVVGHKGSVLKKIGSLARKDIEHFLDRKVYLEIWIKVKRKWSNNSYVLNELGYLFRKKK